jgi:3-hydroxymyristoyl/3-hydroxydecanoyl-(acyl carrier protein) dehydratase
VIFSPELFSELTPARATAVFPASWPAFAGHFPGNPIVPACTLVGLVLAHAESSLGPLALTGIDRMKLARGVGPDEPVTSELQLERHEAEVKLRSRLSCSSGEVGTVVMSARVGA